MDKINASTHLKSNNSIALKNLKAMNKKYAFTVVQKGQRKMAQTMVFRITGATIVNGSF